MFQENIINTPLLINNKKVILIEDSINSGIENEDCLVIESGDDEVTVNSAKLDELKESHSDHVFYGFWSTLLMSGVIEGNGLQVYYTSDNDGYYIYTRDSKIIETGVIVGSHTPSEYKLDLSKAKSIDVDMDKLVLPSEFIKSAGDIYRDMGQKKKELATAVIRASFLALILLAVMAYSLEYISGGVVEEQAQDKKRLSGLISLFQQKKSASNFADVDQGESLDEILNINNVSGGNFEIPKQNIDLDGKVAILPLEVPNPVSALNRTINVKKQGDVDGWVLEW